MLHQQSEAKLPGFESEVGAARELEIQGVVHDLRNHIQGIVLALRTATELAGDSPAKKHLAVALRAARQGSQFLDDMLAIGNPTSKPKNRRVDLVALLASMQPMLSHLAGPMIVLSVTSSDCPLWVGLDENQAQSIITNLVINARDAMPCGGTLAIHLSRRKRNDQDIGEIILGDTGIGMEPAVVERVFDPFFTSGKGKRGTGLGLWVTRKRIEQAGGSVTIESELGRGTCVHIGLPLIDG
jgi:signal transduction histidine kinase